MPGFTRAALSLFTVKSAPQAAPNRFSMSLLVAMILSTSRTPT